jgi:serine phosphatase RsbU (regulator of sigma subunit)
MPVHPRDRPITRLLMAHRTAEPDALVESLAWALQGIDGRDVSLLVIDYAHLVLTPHAAVLRPGSEPEGAASLDGSMAGRAFTSSSVVAVEHDDGWHVWVPVTEQSNRLGILAVTLPRWDDELELLVSELGLAAAPLLMAAAQCTDLLHLLRRRREMDLAAEMQWSLLPPLSFSAGGMTIAGLVEPAYEVGGDLFDYAYNSGVLDLAVLDSVGHGLSSAVLASLLAGAYRHGRRRGDDLVRLAEGIDEAALGFPGEPVFATAILGRLDNVAGTFDWLCCGHPQPLVIHDRVVAPEARGRSRLPLGLGGFDSYAGAVLRCQLQPGDGVLLYTDGVTECRMPDGSLFGEERLRDLFAREHAAGSSPHEVVRRLVRTTIEHSDDGMRDDATLVYVRWEGPPAGRV